MLNYREDERSAGVLNLTFRLMKTCWSQFIMPQNKSLFSSTIAVINHVRLLVEDTNPNQTLEVIVVQNVLLFPRCSFNELSVL